MTLRVRAKVLLHVWSYDWYDMTLFTELQRRHTIKRNMILCLRSTALTGMVSDSGFR